LTVAVILAGGLGMRLRSVVSNMPKPMAEVLGRPFLEHLMDYWIDQGVSHFILSVGYKKESIARHFSNAYRGIGISYVEEEHPLGTGGGLLLASHNLIKPFLLLNGDSYLNVELFKLVDFHERKNSDWTFSLIRANECNRYGGIEVGCNGQIIAFQSNKSIIGSLVNGGVYYLNPKVLRNSGFILGNKYSLEDEIIPMLITKNRKFFGIEIHSMFLDIGVPNDYFEATNMLQSNNKKYLKKSKLKE
jgi:D-glycero-alpha-D-manno-heptose 1-phosphate guanylyltransferase